jgi:hypothetical protein
MSIRYSALAARFLAICLFVLTLPINLLAQNPGAINGFVRNSTNQTPIPGVTISIAELGKSVTSDTNGYYKLSNIPSRTFNVEATGIGFKRDIKYDVIVTSGNVIEINFELEPVYKEINTLELRSTFVKPQGSVNSVQNLGITEIAKYPGANFDIAKVVQSLPGVSGSVGFRNDIIIRGGAPNENAYFLDGIEVPSINHFATQGAAGGPVGLLNVSFIENVTLHTSAFPAKYDNPLSGVLQFKQRTGNPEKIQSNFRFSASEAAITTEGPLGKSNGKTTFIASARRSYLQFLFKAIDLPFLPDYWDYQYKITHKPNASNEINLLGIGAIDNFSFNPPERPTLEQQSILDQIPLNSQRTNTVGISWRHALKRGYWVLSLSNNRFLGKAEKYVNNDDSKDSNKVLQYRSLEDETRVRYELNGNINGWQLSTGAVVIYSNYESNTFQRRPNYAGGGIANNVAEFNTTLDFTRYGLFGQASRRLFDNDMLISIGLRADGNNYTKNGADLLKTISPRISLSYKIAPRWTANASLGRYYKIAPYTILGFRDSTNSLVNKNIDYIRSDHAVAGIEWNPDPSVRITVEGFYKLYSNYPVSFDKGISMANLGGDFDVFGNEQVSSDGKGKAYGFEVMYQKRLTKRLYGILAYTYYNSSFTGKDPDLYIASAWDYRHLISFTGGYKFPRNWELGIRFRYQGKAPYTPYNDSLSKEYYPFTNQPVLDYSRINTLRLRGFNAMDLRLDKKWNFKNWSLDVYLDIQNLFNSKNPTAPDLTLKRNDDNSIATSTGATYDPGRFGDSGAPNNRQLAIPVLLAGDSGARLPTIGFVVEF